jgi:ABC-type transport system involved in Fe-S cluster assembly fused permease/ATPase subunit
MAAFTHVHNLDLEFHLKSNTAEIISALNMGKSVIGNIERICFQFIPMVLDLILVVSYFWVQFGTIYSFLLGIATIAYLATIRMTPKVADATRDLSDAIRKEQTVKWVLSSRNFTYISSLNRLHRNDSISSYESVKYYGGVSRECQRYSDAIDETNRRHYQSAVLTFLLSTCRDALMMICLLSLCMMAAYQITTGQKSVGIFASLLAYMSQLQGPLNYFAGFSLSLQRSFINSERMLELLRKRPEVIDNFGATELTYCEGSIKFTGVKFFYDKEMHILDGLDFECEAGKTVAIVGETGGGKSTIFRLIYRFYNPAEGRLLVDGKDVQEITIDSLRKQIGVVPQDTVLFSETLMYNLRYANPEASDEDIYEACRSAHIHESIKSFSMGYATKVGDRGLRLSGGEKQRIAIARLILKNPRIILLDEATAALDTNTEEKVQRALANLSRGRTVLVVAHRLSTISAADKILVLSNGKISESGTHEELLAANGRYAKLWTKHSRMKEPASKLEGNYANVDEIGLRARANDNTPKYSISL